MSLSSLARLSCDDHRSPRKFPPRAHHLEVHRGHASGVQDNSRAHEAYRLNFSIYQSDVNRPKFKPSLKALKALDRLWQGLSYRLPPPRSPA